MKEPTEKTTTPFTLLESVSATKVDIFSGNEEQYVPFIINRALSYHTDGVLYANEMNRHPDIPPYAQYMYYMGTLRQRKRFAKWAKSQEDDDIELVKAWYGYNDRKARDALRVLTTEQLEELRNTDLKGGEVGKKSKGR